MEATEQRNLVFYSEIIFTLCAWDRLDIDQNEIWVMLKICKILLNIHSMITNSLRERKFTLANHSTSAYVILYIWSNIKWIKVIQMTYSSIKSCSLIWTKLYSNTGIFFSHEHNFNNDDRNSWDIKSHQWHNHNRYSRKFTFLSIEFEHYSNQQWFHLSTHFQKPNTKSTINPSDLTSNYNIDVYQNF